jgi:hypothetical protein
MLNWFGLNNGKFIGEPPSYVNKDLKPGLSEVPRPTLIGWLQKAPTILITTPNFVWGSVALLLYRFFPYDLSSTSIAASGPLTAEFFWNGFHSGFL